MFDVIAFDADDTLWQNEEFYSAAQERFKKLLAPYASPEVTTQKLYEIEVRNLPLLGYGIKAFVLSMIETALELSAGKISASEIRQVLQFGFDMLEAKIEVFEQVEEVLSQLAQQYQLMLITKGDLLDQENKLSRSGLAQYFKSIEIVSVKNKASYQSILARHNLEVQRFVMVGNSLRSDILPVIELGGKAVFIPHSLTWAHEHVHLEDAEYPGLYELDHIGGLPALLESIKNNGA
jgi:putative hydrolase of the HAD superfamily